MLGLSGTTMPRGSRGRIRATPRALYAPPLCVALLRAYPRWGPRLKTSPWDSTSLVLYDPRTADPVVIALAGFYRYVVEEGPSSTHRPCTSAGPVSITSPTPSDSTATRSVPSSAADLASAQDHALASLLATHRLAPLRGPLRRDGALASSTMWSAPWRALSRLTLSAFVLACRSAPKLPTWDQAFPVGRHPGRAVKCPRSRRRVGAQRGRRCLLLRRAFQPVPPEALVPTAFGPRRPDRREPAAHRRRVDGRRRP